VADTAATATLSRLIPRPDRAVLQVGGRDRVTFLQGLVSNDVQAAKDGTAVWAALLTPQGKYLADFFIFARPDHLLLDVEAAFLDDLQTRLRRYRLRSDVEIAPAPLSVAVTLPGAMPSVGGAIVAADPRLPEAGWRILLPDSSPSNAAPDAAEIWDRHRLALGLPDGTRDLERERTVLMEAGFDELHGISWTKGCYMGQELTARTRYRGLVKRRLFPVEADAALPPPGTPILLHGQEAGIMRSSNHIVGLAQLRLEAWNQTLEAGGIRLHARKPDWMRLPD
jgi:folate-binding protein YgfZ